MLSLFSKNSRNAVGVLLALNLMQGSVIQLSAQADEESDWISSLRDGGNDPVKAVQKKSAASKDESKSADGPIVGLKARSADLTGGKVGASWNSPDKPVSKAISVPRLLPDKLTRLDTETVSDPMASSAKLTGSEADEGANEYGTLDTLNAASLRSHAKNHMKKGHYKMARKLAEKAVAGDPENTDGRQIHAEALEAILKKQDPKDAHDFNLCVKQWFYLFRHAEFDDDRGVAAHHLKTLTGSTPQPWMKTKSYLSKVLMPEEHEDEEATEIASEEPPQVP